MVAGAAKETKTMVTEILIIAALIIAAVYFVDSRRAKAVRQFNRRHASTYRLNRLTQQSFNKAFNIVSDLVKNDGADIEVVYKDEVVFNGYVDRDDKLKDTPMFWYNKALLDKYGIEY